MAGGVRVKSTAIYIPLAPPNTGFPHLPLSVWITPGVLVGVVLLGLAYVVVMWSPAIRDLPGVEAPTTSQVLYFVAALCCLYLALGSPVGVLAMGYSFTAHMLQHMIAALAVPPFLIKGLPPWVWRALVRPRPVRYVFGILVRPVWAILVFNAVFTVMILPSVITAMVHSMPVMVAWHLGLAVTGIFMWWPLLSPLDEFPRLHPGVQTLYLFADGIPMIMPFVLVTLDNHPLYSLAYGATKDFLGLSLVADQNLGGALCLVLVHVVYGSMLIARFFDWVRLEPAIDPALAKAAADKQRRRFLVVRP
jgi:putative membrane protein